MKDLGKVHWFLGLEIMRDRPRRTIMLSQECYTLDILGHFNMLDSHPISTPMAAGIKLERLDAPSNPQIQQTYQQMLGCLMYTMTCTHPDLAYAVGALSRHSAAPGPDHLTASLPSGVSSNISQAPTMPFSSMTAHSQIRSLSDTLIQTGQVTPLIADLLPATRS